MRDHVQPTVVRRCDPAWRLGGALVLLWLWAAGAAEPAPPLLRIVGYMTPDWQFGLMVENTGRPLSGRLSVRPLREGEALPAGGTTDLLVSGDDTWSVPVRFAPYERRRFTVPAWPQDDSGAAMRVEFAEEHGLVQREKVEKRRLVGVIAGGDASAAALVMTRDVQYALALPVGAADLSGPCTDAPYASLIVGLRELVEFDAAQVAFLSDHLALGRSLTVVDNLVGDVPPLSGPLRAIFPFELGRKDAAVPGAALEAISACRFPAGLALAQRTVTAGPGRTVRPGAFLWEFPRGLGLVRYIAFDALGAELIAWPGSGKVWAEWIRRAWYPSASPPVQTALQTALRAVRAGVRGGGGLHGLALRLANPTAGLVVALLGTLTILNFGIWRRYRRGTLSLTRVLILEWLIAGVVFVFLAAARLLGDNAARRYGAAEVAWLMPESQRATVTTAVSVLTQTRSRFAVEWATPVDRVYATSWPLARDGGCALRLLAAGPVAATDLSLSAFERQTLTAQTLIRSDDRIEGALTLAQDMTVSGELTNRAATTFSAACLMIQDLAPTSGWRPKYRYVRLPGLRPGESWRLDAAPVEPDDPRLWAGVSVMGLVGERPLAMLNYRHNVPVVLFVGVRADGLRGPRLRPRDEMDVAQFATCQTLPLRLVGFAAEPATVAFEPTERVRLKTEEKAGGMPAGGAFAETTDADAMFPAMDGPLYGKKGQMRLAHAEGIVRLSGRYPGNVPWSLMLIPWRVPRAHLSFSCSWASGDAAKAATGSGEPKPGQAVLRVLDQQRGEWVEVWHANYEPLATVGEADLRTAVRAYRLRAAGATENVPLPAGAAAEPRWVGVDLDLPAPEPLLPEHRPEVTLLFAHHGTGPGLLLRDLKVTVDLAPVGQDAAAPAGGRRP